MKRELQISYAADRLWLKARWALMLIWTVVAWDSADEQWLWAGCLFGAVSGIVIQLITRTPDGYRKLGQKVVSHSRFVDIMLPIAATIYGPQDMANVWMISIPGIIFEALSTRNARRVTLVSIVATVITLYGVILHEDLRTLIASGFGIVFSGFVGLTLARFQAKDQILRDRDRRLSTLMNTSSNVAASGDLRQLIQGTLKSAIQDIGATAGMVVLTSDEDPGLLITEAAYSQAGDFFFPMVVAMGDGISGYVAKEGQPITLTAKEGETVECDGIGLAIKSAVSVPLLNREFRGVGMAINEQIIGAMTIVNTEGAEALEAEELDLLQSLSSLLANAIHNARMEERNRATFLRTLESLATALEARDDYTRGHSQRVCDLSVMIGSKLGLTPDALEELRIGTILHDIGKIGVPDAILNKPGRLTEDEFNFMRTHPVIGYEICRPLMLSDGVLMIIRNHHEKLDGSGYPDGLKGGELPLSLRIVCVADAFDAMSSRRPYRGVMDMSHVMGELSKGAGIQFDSVVVEALKELLTAGELDDLYSAYWGPKFEALQAKLEDKAA
ncbi:MAG: HD domain-containing protein [Fimbriimonas sp.]|nr:HD domain-containing protein [Fimbriimonas sp.]